LSFLADIIDDQLKIMTSINDVSLVTGSVPNQKMARVHLPLRFAFGFEEVIMLDLWKIDTKQQEHSRVPTMILNEQAILLGQKTKNIVTASVIPLDPPKRLIQLDDMAGLVPPLAVSTKER
jgi:hypothetical protein